MFVALLVARGSRGKERRTRIWDGSHDSARLDLHDHDFELEVNNKDTSLRSNYCEGFAVLERFGDQGKARYIYIYIYMYVINLHTVSLLTDIILEALVRRHEILNLHLLRTVVTVLARSTCDLRKSLTAVQAAS